MKKSDIPELQSVGSFLDVLSESERDLRTIYYDDPIGLAERLGLLMPEKPVVVMQREGVYDPEKHGPITPGLREWVQDVCSVNEEATVAVAGRGCGKSMGVSFIEFFLVFIKKFDALNFGGSESQAQNVYLYLQKYIESDPYWQDLVKGESLQSQTTLIFNNWIKVLTASPKSVRSPHAGGHVNGGMGGLLVIDEEAETDATLVKDALATVNTANPSVICRCSTFHNAVGSFAEIVENHEEMGYKIYRWNIFDVAKKCDCVGECQSEERCFREDHWEVVTDPNTGITENKLIHKAHCGGKAMYASGWVNMSEIVKLWKGYRRNHAIFEVEAMGSRPTSAGFVIKDKGKLDENIVKDNDPRGQYKDGFPISICVDWGSDRAAISVWQEQFPDIHVVLHAEQYEEYGESQILGEIVGLYNKYGNEVFEIAADIGGGGSYLNPKMREEYRYHVRDVNFAQENETAASAWNIYNEANKIVIPERFEEFIKQIKKWRRVNTKIGKGNFHICDTGLVYFARFVDRLQIRRAPVGPKKINTVPQIGIEKIRNQENDIPVSARGRNPNRRTPRMVRPVARGLKKR